MEHKRQKLGGSECCDPHKTHTFSSTDSVYVEELVTLKFLVTVVMQFTIF